MRHRNAIEGTISELVRGHGLRRARYKGFAKVDLQNHLVAAACNIKRWLRKLSKSASTSSQPASEAYFLAHKVRTLLSSPVIRVFRHSFEVPNYLCFR
jgi:hypothetical protein